MVTRLGVRPPPAAPTIRVEDTVAMTSDNRALYDLGRGYAGQVALRLAGARGEKAAVAGVAAAAGGGVKEVRTALDFFRHVEAAEQAAPGARRSVLGGGHPHLTPAVVARLARLRADRVRAAVARAGAGLHPLAPDPPAGTPPDEAPWHFDLSRLRKARSLLLRAAGAEFPGPGPSAADRADLAVHAAAIRADLDALRPLLGGDPRGATAAPPRVRPGDSDVARWAAQARRLVEAVTGDLLRAAHARPVGVA